MKSKELMYKQRMARLNDALAARRTAEKTSKILQALESDGFCLFRLPNKVLTLGGRRSRINVDHLNRALARRKVLRENVFNMWAASDVESDASGSGRAMYAITGGERVDGKKKRQPAKCLTKRHCEKHTSTVKSLVGLVGRISTYLRDLFPACQLEMNDPVVITSTASCPEQEVHLDGTDYNRTQHPSWVADSERGQPGPLSCIVALQPGTSILAWPGGHHLFKVDRVGPCPDTIRRDTVSQIKTMIRHSAGGQLIPKRRISIPPGNIVLFRQDLPHAGSGYTGNNTRLHMYVEPKGYKRTPNATGNIAKSMKKYFAEIEMVSD